MCVVHIGYLHGGRILLGTLRNVSSAGEPARVFMRSCVGLVDALLWTINSAVKRNDDIDNKVCTVYYVCVHVCGSVCVHVWSV